MPNQMFPSWTRTTCIIATFCGYLLCTIVSVNGQEYESTSGNDRNCRRVRGHDGNYAITSNDNSLYCFHQQLYQSALAISPSNASSIYVQSLARSAMSRCGSKRYVNNMINRERERYCRNGRPRRQRNRRRSSSRRRSSRRMRHRNRRCQWLRKEVRMMSRSEWRRFVNRLNILKTPIDIPNHGPIVPYDIISDIHRPWDILMTAHGGPNFLGWHRIYLLVLEAALGVPVPYWDSRLDYEMTDPTASTLWTDDFVGPGFGVVDSGPFSTWITPDNFRLMRNIGSGGSLISYRMVKDILAFIRHDPVVFPSNNITIEGVHNGPHVWVDGQMSGLQTGPQDPVFFLHHGFIDYIWYLFRENMRRANPCINPATDYPKKGRDSHRHDAPMIPFNLRNIHGYSDLAEYLTSYEPSPQCPRCGRSRYLECNRTTRMCMSKAVRRRTSPTTTDQRRVLALGSIAIGPRFVSDFTDSRTRGDALFTTALTRRTALI